MRGCLLTQEAVPWAESWVRVPLQQAQKVSGVRNMDSRRRASVTKTYNSGVEPLGLTSRAAGLVLPIRRAVPKRSVAKTFHFPSIPVGEELLAGHP